jgi:transcriptional regulator with XRE-family HTH domain
MVRSTHVQISLDEIRELLSLRGWRQQDLAVELGLSRSTIERWFSRFAAYRRYPSVAEHIVLLQWLAEARAETRSEPASA